MVAVKNHNVKTPLNHTGPEALFLLPLSYVDFVEDWTYNSSRTG